MTEREREAIRRRDGIFGLILILAMIVAVCVGWSTFVNATDGGDAPQPAPTSTAQLQEDDPGWDCATMGNRVCGPTATTTTSTH